MIGARVLPRIQVGIPGFDDLVHGGLPEGRSTPRGRVDWDRQDGVRPAVPRGGREHGEPRGPGDVRRAPGGHDRQRGELRVGSRRPGARPASRHRGRDAGAGRRSSAAASISAGSPARIEHALKEVGGSRLFLDPIDALFEEFSDVARGAPRVRRDAARAAAAGRDDADRRRAPERGRSAHALRRGGVRRRQRRPAAQRARGGAPAPDGRGPQAARRRPSQGRVPVRHRRRAPASRSCRSRRSRATPTGRPSGSRSETPSWTRCAAAACTATR